MLRPDYFSEHVEFLKAAKMLDSGLTEETIKQNLKTWGYIVENDECFKDGVVEACPSMIGCYTMTKEEFEKANG